jgi:PAS domain S-box-containing protein
LGLGRELHLGLPAEALAERFLAGIMPLFPGRVVAIRLLVAWPVRSGAEALAALLRRGQRDLPASRRIQAVATPGARHTPAALEGPLLLKRTSVDKTKLGRAAVDEGWVRLVDAVPAAFQDDDGTPAGFSVPLVAGGDIYGALDVGYPSGTRPTLEEDERDLLPIANQLSVALRNAWLHGEAELLRDYLAKLVDHADALIVGVDRQFRVTVFNQALAQLVGWPAQLVVGRDVRDWLPEPERVRFSAIVQDGLAGRSTRAFDLELRTRNGESVRTLWNVAALGAEGSAEAVVAVGQDVTRLRSLERQVIQAEKLSQLGQLAAGVVHELNNPLTSISVYADFLLKRLERGAPIEPGDIEKLRRIVEGAERIQNFARSLVQYAKPSPASPERIALGDVVKQGISFCEHMIRKTDARLGLDVDDELPPVFAVRGQLQQVVINLVTNALHALPGSGGIIRVSTFRHGGEMVGLSVEDNGHGIRAEDRGRIFEPFFTTKVDGRGTGLGLSIVRNIVDAHRGEIDVDSLPGRGTLFKVILPRATD